MLVRIKPALVAVAVAAAALSACDRERPSVQAQTAATPAPSLMSRQYFEAAANGDLFEVRSSELALQRTRNAQVRRFAQMMVDDHSANSRALEQAVGEAGLSARFPSQLDDAHMATYRDLEGASPRAFDARYVDAQRQAHQDALALNRAYAQNGDVPALRRSATAAVPVIERHIRMLDQIRLARR